MSIIEQNLSMSTSSSSAASGDDVAVVAEVDDVKDVSGFNGWAHEEICFDDEPKASKTALHLAAEESARDWGDWTGTDEKKVTKKKNMKVGVCEGDESYEGITEPEEEEEEPSYAPTTDVPKPPPSPELEMESLDEEEEEESVTPRPQYEPAPPRPATLPEPQKGDDKRYVPIPPPIVEEGGDVEGESDSEFETEEFEPPTPQPGAGGEKVDPIPKETLPELANRGEEGAEAAAPAPATKAEPAQSKEEQKSLETAKDVQNIVEKNLNEKNAVIDSVKDLAALTRLRDALQEFHKYATTPSSSRAPTFRNQVFNARSKEITDSRTIQLRLALKCVEKMISAVGVKEADKTRFTVAPVDTSVDKLISQLSHAFCAYVSSQQALPSDQRRALAQMLIVNVVKGAMANNSVSRTTLILAATVANLLTAEAAALKTAALVSPSPQSQARYNELRAKILKDVDDFLKSISSAIPSEASTKKILTSISTISEKFSAAALQFAPIACKDGEKGDASYATALAVLLHQFVQYGPAVTEYIENRDFLVLLAIQSNMLMPDLIMYPEAMYDVLSGMLTGVKGTFNVIDSPQDRAKIIEAWKAVKSIISEQHAFLVQSKPNSEPIASKPTTITAINGATASSAPTRTLTTTTTTTKAKATTEKKAAQPSVSLEEEYISRWSHISDDDEDEVQ